MTARLLERPPLPEVFDALIRRELHQKTVLRHGGDATEAFAILRRASQNRNTKPREVAEHLRRTTTSGGSPRRRREHVGTAATP